MQMPDFLKTFLSAPASDIARWLGIAAGIIVLKLVACVVVFRAGAWLFKRFPPMFNRHK
ncbi:hypothetical protein J1782_07090 [Rahnella sp. BCC 1045]|uniref:hypothetical protein n=1 Tax=Rahnella sp. BCC 1045 TaxID=2816251 RepID=UPI001C254832|nr:hypothetical protein [Rahnella sp. BCC 1045]MBU9819650.1 hypothetical protein [Rahnella sp. BCC 1045]